VTAAVDVGGTHVRGAVVDEAGTGVLAEPVERPLLGTESAAEIVSAIASCVLPATGPFAIAMPGPFGYRSGVGRFEPGGKFAVLRDVDVRTALASELGCEPGRIDFVNDAAAYGLGEWRCGAGRGHDRLLVLTLGTGIGSAFVERGRAVSEGPGLPPDGHVHHLTYDGRNIEETFSRNAIRRAYAHATGAGVEVAEIAARARHEDAIARGVLAAAASGLGRALAPCIETFGPELLVIGGGIAASWDLLDAPFRSGLGRDLEIHVGRLGALAPLIGAAHHARNP
jgi:glucokinase